MCGVRSWLSLQPGKVRREEPTELTQSLGTGSCLDEDGQPWMHVEERAGRRRPDGRDSLRISR